MKRGKIILWVSVIIALAIAALIYFNWNPEHLLRMNEKTVFLADIEQNGREAYIGSLEKKNFRQRQSPLLQRSRWMWSIRGLMN